MVKNLIISKLCATAGSVVIEAQGVGFPGNVTLYLSGKEAKGLEIGNKLMVVFIEKEEN